MAHLLNNFGAERENIGIKIAIIKRKYCIFALLNLLNDAVSFNGLKLTSP